MLNLRNNIYVDDDGYMWRVDHKFDGRKIKLQSEDNQRAIEIDVDTIQIGEENKQLVWDYMVGNNIRPIGTIQFLDF